MGSDVVLTSALRTNLLSLQNTQRLIDTTQQKLATGLKVNSALDNPQSFFTAQSLNNRAGDLTRLLDGIGQSIRAIEQADQGITALTNLVDQADSIAASARDELLATDGNARLIGNVDLTTTANEDLIAGAGVTDGDVFTITTTDSTGTQISETITINATTGGTLSAEGLAAQITNAFADNQGGEISARVTSQGFLEIQSDNGQAFRIADSDVGSGTEVTDAVFTALGLGDAFAIESYDNGGAQTRAAATVLGGSEIRSTSIYEASGDIAEAGDLLTGTYQDADGNTIISGFAAADTIDFTVDGNTLSFTVDAGDTFQDLVDAINDDADLGDDIEASFDTSTGQIRIAAISASATGIQIEATSAAGGAFDLDFGDTTGNVDDVSVTATVAEARNYAFSRSSDALETLAIDYNEVRAQIDGIVNDANYRGINLLQGDNATTFFNEDRTSSLVTEGVDFSANGLGLNEATFTNSDAVDATLSEVRNALSSVRDFGTTLSNDLSIIQTRRDFTEGTINTLQAGADDLTVADQNEEGANLLALQTRQALGVTSLSLASQSAQSVLRLF